MKPSFAAPDDSGPPPLQNEVERSSWVSALYGIVVAMGALSVLEPRLSVFSVLCGIVALASLSKRKDPSRLWYLALALGLGFSVLGLGRFVFAEALPGIIEARGRESGKKAVSLLREVYFAENALRRYAMIDPDGDGIGSAGTLSEMTGDIPARGHIELSPPPLALRLTPREATRLGPATLYDGHLVMVCVPAKGGGWTARVEDDDSVDEELAERNWVAYAWPSEAGLPHHRVYFIDQHERILFHENLDEQDLRFVGALRPPPCHHATADSTAGEWQAWEGKRARTTLPGDLAAAPDG